MKKWKKLLLMCTLILAMGTMSACGMGNNTGDDSSNEADQDQNSGDNGADSNGTSGTNDAAPNGTTGENNSGTNGAADENGTGANGSEGGIIEDAGDALQEGVNDMENGVEDVLDGNSGQENLDNGNDGSTGERTMDGKVAE